MTDHVAEAVVGNAISAAAAIPKTLRMGRMLARHGFGERIA
jgi:hypothetical protein